MASSMRWAMESLSLSFTHTHTTKPTLHNMTYFSKFIVLDSLEYEMGHRVIIHGQILVLVLGIYIGVVILVKT